MTLKLTVIRQEDDPCGCHRDHYDNGDSGWNPCEAHNPDPRSRKRDWFGIPQCRVSLDGDIQQNIYRIRSVFIHGAFVRKCVFENDLQALADKIKSITPEDRAFYMFHEGPFLTVPGMNNAIASSSFAIPESRDGWVMALTSMEFDIVGEMGLINNHDKAIAPDGSIVENAVDEYGRLIDDIYFGEGMRKHFQVWAAGQKAA